MKYTEAQYREKFPKHWNEMMSTAQLIKEGQARYTIPINTEVIKTIPDQELDNYINSESELGKLIYQKYRAILSGDFCWVESEDNGNHLEFIAFNLINSWLKSNELYLSDKWINESINPAERQGLLKLGENETLIILISCGYCHIIFDKITKEYLEGKINESFEDILFSTHDINEYYIHVV